MLQLRYEGAVARAASSPMHTVERNTGANMPWCAGTSATGLGTRRSGSDESETGVVVADTSDDMLVSGRMYVYVY